MKTVLLVGAGQFGIHIAQKMSEMNCEIMAVDSDEARVNEILPLVTNAQIGDSTNESFMRSLGIPDFDVCIVTISGSFQNSLETTALLKDLGARKVIARAQNDVQEKFLRRNGADETVYPEKQTAYRLAVKEASDDILDSFEIDPAVSIYEVRVPKEWDGRTVAAIDLRRKYQLNMIAVRAGGRLSVPMPDTMLRTGDQVLVIGSQDDLRRCFKI
ncbi:MAG: TrkA family potassium uptake protein [Oscillospiraceae bacterium]|nr:TrkA family potassium uptake protein [Oscillospiraceae bacterium]